jgi:hypothetical protein
MTIASKSDGLILKDGALATNCGCCNTCNNNLSGTTSVTIELASGPDFLRHRTRGYTRNGVPVTQKESHAIFSSALNGVHVLTKQFSSSGIATNWGKTITGQPSQCGDIVISLQLYNIPSNTTITPYPQLGDGFHFQLTIQNIRAAVRSERSLTSNSNLTTFYALNEIDCTDSFSDDGTVRKVTGSAQRQIFLVSICQNSIYSTVPSVALFDIPIADVTLGLIGNETDLVQEDEDVGSKTIEVVSVSVI